MLAHDVAIMNINEGPNPDNMSYEVLLSLISNCWNLEKALEKCRKEFPKNNLNLCHARKILAMKTSIISVIQLSDLLHGIQCGRDCSVFVLQTLLS